MDLNLTKLSSHETPKVQVATRQVRGGAVMPVLRPYNQAREYVFTSKVVEFPNTTALVSTAFDNGTIIRYKIERDVTDRISKPIIVHQLTADSSSGASFTDPNMFGKLITLRTAHGTGTSNILWSCSAYCQRVLHLILPRDKWDNIQYNSHKVATPSYTYSNYPTDLTNSAVEEYNCHVLGSPLDIIKPVMFTLSHDLELLYECSKDIDDTGDNTLTQTHVQMHVDDISGADKDATIADFKNNIHSFTYLDTAEILHQQAMVASTQYNIDIGSHLADKLVAGLFVTIRHSTSATAVAYRTLSYDIYRDGVIDVTDGVGKSLIADSNGLTKTQITNNWINHFEAPSNHTNHVYFIPFTSSFTDSLYKGVRNGGVRLHNSSKLRITAGADFSSATYEINIQAFYYKESVQLGGRLTSYDL